MKKEDNFKKVKSKNTDMIEVDQKHADIVGVDEKDHAKERTDSTAPRR